MSNDFILLEEFIIGVVVPLKFVKKQIYVYVDFWIRVDFDFKGGFFIS